MELKEIGKAAKKGGNRERIALGRLLLQGYGTGKDCLTPDVKQAAAWLAKVKDDGEADLFGGYAQMKLGDAGRACKLLERASAQGEWLADWLLAGLKLKLAEGTKKRMQADKLRGEAAAMALANRQTERPPAIYARALERCDGASEDDLKGIFSDFAEAARGGCPEAVAAVGVLLMTGRGTEKNEEKAAVCLAAAAERGVSYAAYALGCMYVSGKGIPRDNRRAAELFLSAHEAQIVEASVARGACLLYGLGVKTDGVKAFNYFQNALSRDPKCVSAAYYLGICHAEGIGVKENFSAADSYLRKAGADGLFMLGNLYAARKKPDYKKAAAAYQEAYEAGSEEAGAELAQLLFEGKGAGKDEVRAFAMAEQLAERGIAAGNRVLGLCYLAKPAVNEALECLEKAAEAGDLAAAQKLYSIYRDDLPDKEKRGAYLIRRAELGDAAIYYTVAGLFAKGDKGLKIPKDGGASAYWYAMAGKFSPLKSEREKAANRAEQFDYDRETGQWDVKAAVEKNKKARKRAAKADKKGKKAVETAAPAAEEQPSDSAREQA